VDLRWVAVVVLIAGAVLIGVADNTSQHWLRILAVACFAVGAVLFLRWRARVLDREEKTSPDD
jgi:drug/metabolite transporter (DMT)-like permease